MALLVGARAVVGAMTLTWFPNTNQGFMPGDYTSLTFVNRLAYPIIGIATANSGKVFNATMNAPVTGLSDGLGLNSSAGEKPVRNFHSDAPARTYPCATAARTTTKPELALRPMPPFCLPTGEAERGLLFCVG